MPLSGNHLILQLAQKAWAGVPFATGEWIVNRAVGDLEVPGVDRSASPRFLVERRDVGRHRFVCISTRIPFPASVADAVRQGILDRASLDQLAGFYEGQPKSNGHMIAFDMVVGRPGKR